MWYVFNVTLSLIFFSVVMYVKSKIFNIRGYPISSRIATTERSKIEKYGLKGNRLTTICMPA